MRFFICTLAATAWTAITSRTFPALARLDINPDKDLGFVPHLTALCLDWPTEHPLSIELRYFAGAQVIAANLGSMLQAKGKRHITVQGWDQF
jgi:hypothetical protein